MLSLLNLLNRDTNQSLVVKVKIVVTFLIMLQTFEHQLKLYHFGT